MKLDEALEYFKRIQCSDCGRDKESCETKCKEYYAINIAISSIEKKIPKRAIYLEDESTHLCPTCHGTLDPYGLYCAECGQRWD